MWYGRVFFDDIAIYSFYFILIFLTNVHLYTATVWMV